MFKVLRFEIMPEDDGSDDGWLELRVEKDAEQNPNEFETMLNEIKGDMS